MYKLLWPRSICLGILSSWRSYRKEWVRHKLVTLRRLVLCQFEKRKPNFSFSLKIFSLEQHRVKSTILPPILYNPRQWIPKTKYFSPHIFPPHTDENLAILCTRYFLMALQKVESPLYDSDLCGLFTHLPRVTWKTQDCTRLNEWEQQSRNVIVLSLVAVYSVG